MYEMIGHSGFEERRLQLDLRYDRFLQELREKDMEDRLRGYVDIGGYNVPYHLQNLVLERGMHPDRVCAISDLFGSTDEYTVAEFSRHSKNPDPRLTEVDTRWARLAAEEAERLQSGLFPEN